MKVTCLMAQTLDGKIGKDSNHFPDWTEKADKKLFVAETKKSGVMIFGSSTFDTLPGVLPGRLHVIMSRKAGDWDDRGKNLVYTSLSPQKILEKLAELGFDNPIVAGGAIINTLFAKENLIDEIILTISPKIFGEGLGIFRSEIEMELELRAVEKIGENTIKTVYSVVK